MSIQYSEFEGRSVIVTGGASGIGEATVRRLADQGAKILIADVNEQMASDLAEEICDSGGKACSFAVDVSTSSDVDAMVKFAVETYGALNYAVNSAGVTQVSIPLIDQDEALFDRIMQINVKGVWLSMKYEIPALLRQGGAIVNVASVTAVVGGSPGNACYVGSKHAVLGLTRSASLDYAAKGVRINAICPGAVDTPLIRQFSDGKPEVLEQVGNAHPIGRIGSAQEVAESILFLLSEGSSFTTGAAMLVDGGYSVP